MITGFTPTLNVVLLWLMLRPSDKFYEKKKHPAPSRSDRKKKPPASYQLVFSHKRCVLLGSKSSSGRRRSKRVSAGWYSELARGREPQRCPALEGMFFNQSQWCIEWTGCDWSQITEIVFLMLPSGPLTPAFPFFQLKCRAATPSTYGKTAIWLTVTGLKVPTMIRVSVVKVHVWFSLHDIKTSPLLLQVVCSTKWRGISTTIPVLCLKRLKVSPVKVHVEYDSIPLAHVRL